jgi:flagellar motor switch protein FliN/FliY
MSERNLQQILALEVPLVVVLGERTMHVSEVMALLPGAIIELPKNADSELSVLVNDRVIGVGSAVKVGENFGIRLNYIGDVSKRVAALSPAAPAASSEETPELSPEQLAEAMLAGQA